MQLQMNFHGRPGKIISCDFHMEHLNPEAKQSVTVLGSNITDEAVIKRVGKSIAHTVKIFIVVRNGHVKRRCRSC